jgi:hypothetical protein
MRVAAVKGIHVHLIKDVIFSIQHDTIVVYKCCVVFSVPSIWPFSALVIPVFLLEYCIMTLRIRCLLWKLSFDVLSVIFMLHNLRFPFKILFNLVPHIVFSFRAHSFFYLGTIRRFSLNGTTVSHWSFYDNRRMNTSADVSKLEVSPFSCLYIESA